MGDMVPRLVTAVSRLIHPLRSLQPYTVRDPGKISLSHIIVKLILYIVYAILYIGLFTTRQHLLLGSKILCLAGVCPLK